MTKDQRTYKNGAFLSGRRLIHTVGRRSQVGLYPNGLISLLGSGRRAEKSFICSSAHGFRVSKRFYAGCSQVAQLLDVVTKCHHRHSKVGTRLPDRANQFATHLRDLTDPGQQKT